MHSLKNNFPLLYRHTLTSLLFPRHQGLLSLMAEGSSSQRTRTMVGWGGVANNLCPQWHSSLQLFSCLDPDQNVAENDQPSSDVQSERLTGLCRPSLPGKISTRSSLMLLLPWDPASSGRMLWPFWSVRACIAFVFSGLRSG